MNMKIVCMQLFNKSQRNSRIYQIMKTIRMTRPSVKEWLVTMLGNVSLDYGFISCKKAKKAGLYLDRVWSAAVIQESPIHDSSRINPFQFSSKFVHPSKTLMS
jgi:hypothetical protein